MTPTPLPAAEVTLAIEPLSWDGIATVLAAVLAAIVAVLGYSIQQRIARKERRAVIYSEALRAVEDYLEAPYLVRRRDGSTSARQTITTHISDIQSRLSYYCALLDIHAHSEISTAYRTLVSAARAEGGKAMSQAWKSRPTRRDGGVPIRARYDRSRSDDARQGYSEAIRHRDA